MEAVLVHVQDALNRRVFPLAYQEELTPFERLDKMLRRLGKNLFTGEGGCIVGNTTLETSLLVPEFRTILQQIFESWIQAQTHLYAYVYSPDQAKQLAEQTVMEFEGAIMFSKLYNDTRYITTCFERALDRMNASKTE